VGSKLSPTTFVLVNNQGLRFELEPQPRVLGRGRSCDFVVNGKSVSRQHAQICVESKSMDAPIRIKDLGSLNGTFVRSERIEQEYARPGDRVRFGRMEFRIEALFVDEDESTVLVTEELWGENPFNLSPAQYRVLLALLDGSTEKKAASKLNVSRHTVHNHLREIYARFNVSSRAELLSKVFSRGQPAE
jgi:pSer/pThr/pTyr-binding forkhead associated (FHA) protein